MNPLTQVKQIQKINAKEASLGISDEASWHAKYKDSAYIFVGGVPYDLTEGDLLAIFAQYGEIVDVNLVRDKATGKSKGFAFIAYEDQRSTILAVDNLNGKDILGRIIKVDHVSKYKKKEEEDEEAEKQKREARGVCRAFQKGECNRGAGCRFSHDEQRAANTGWGPRDDKNAKWGNEKFEAPARSDRRTGQSNRGQPVDTKDAWNSREHKSEDLSERHDKRKEINSREDYNKSVDRRSERKERESFVKDLDTHENERRSTKNDSDLPSRGDRDGREEKRSRKHESESGDRDGREEKRSRKQDSESYHREERDKMAREKRSNDDRESHSHRRRGMDEDHQKRSHR